MTTQFDADDIIDLREVTERVEELRDGRDEYNDKMGDPSAWDKIEDGEPEELAELEALLSELAGYGGDHLWEGEWYPLALIADDYFVEAMRELVMDIGDMPREFPSYLEIDWNATAENLRVDYSSIKFNGTTYWYR